MIDQSKYRSLYCPSCNWIGNYFNDKICPNCGHDTYEGFFSNKEPQWLRTDDPVYVAFLDVLGFKSLVANNTIDSLFHIYKEFLTTMDFSKLFSDSSYKSDSLRNTIVDSLFISDSLILWTEDFSQNSLFKLSGLVSMLIAESLLIGTPIRGAIDMGEIAVGTSWTNKTIVGKGLTNAYQSEESQEWAGCLVSERCLDQFNKLSDLKGALKENFLLDIDLLVRYPIPLKKKQHQTNIAVNWPYLLKKESLSKKIITESFLKFNKTSNDCGTRRKIRNTIKFYDFVKNMTIRDLVKP
jgi:hypothetical protein